MDAEIFYFSGTGNSLVIARDVAHNIGARLTSMTDYNDDTHIEVHSNIIGLVFPVYYEPYGGIPLLVRRFVSKIDNLQSKYIFAICTYGSASVITLKTLEEHIKDKGGRLDAEFTVNMPNNMGGKKINNKNQQKKMFQSWKENQDKIIGIIQRQEQAHWDSPHIMVGRFYPLLKIFINPIISLFRPLTLKHLHRYCKNSSDYEKLLPYMDRSFHSTNKCVGCANCAKVCPVNNIELLDSRPKWKHQCEFCLACFHWCPHQAIKSQELTHTIHYHHPQVKFSDMIEKQG